MYLSVFGMRACVVVGIARYPRLPRLAEMRRVRTTDERHACAATARRAWAMLRPYRQREEIADSIAEQTRDV